LRAYPVVQPLYVRAGLRWEAAEVRTLKRLLAALRSPRLRPLAVIDVPTSDLYGVHWSTSGRGVPDYDAGDASVYLPGRNIALFSKTATFCALRGLGVIVSGILSANPFPDGSPSFFRAMERALSLGLGAPVRIRAPYRRLTKDRLIRRGRALPLHRTLSCIAPARGDRHCGRCCKCAERIEAFRRARVPDRTLYASPPPANGAGAVGSPRAASVRNRTTRAAPYRTTSSR
jgi:7-cyano-7-deazaguanine synthase